MYNNDFQQSMIDWLKTKFEGAAVLIDKIINANGVYEAVNDNADGYKKVTVNVPQPSGTKQISITQNGTTTEDVEQYEDAEITVNVPVPILESKSITANGTYTPPSGKAWNEVVVNVPALESVSGTITPASDASYSSPWFVHNFGTYDVFVMLYVDDENYTELVNGNYAGAQVLKITAVLGTLNKDSHVKKFGCSKLQEGSIGITTCSIHNDTTINAVKFSLAVANWFRAGITYKYKIVKYGENTTERGG